MALIIPVHSFEIIDIIIYVQKYEALEKIPALIMESLIKPSTNPSKYNRNNLSTIKLAFQNIIPYFTSFQNRSKCQNRQKFDV